MNITTTLLSASICMIGTLMLTNCSSKDDISQKQVSSSGKKRVLLLGASIGQGWKLPDFSTRVMNDNYDGEAIAAWQYDKTDTLDEILMRPKRQFKPNLHYIKGLFQPSPQKPYVIILKECAAYFPGDYGEYKQLIQKWTRRISDAKIRLILATVVPVTRERARSRPGQIESILEFNDWIREYAKSENIMIIDLEAQLREDGEKRFLKNEFSTDGLHLNKQAYDLLDKQLLETLLRLE